METENPQSLAVKNGNQILLYFVNNLQMFMQSNERWINGAHCGIYLKSCCSCYQQYGNQYGNPQNIF